MKKILIVAIVGILLLGASLYVFADTNNELPTWFYEMMEWKKAQVEKAVDEGTITKDEAESYIERIDEMKEFHEKEGFNMPFGFGKGSKQGFGCGNGFRRGNGMFGNFNN